MTPDISRILIILLGLALLFAGLPIYRNTIKVAGFIVGAGYGVYLFSMFAKSIQLEPLLIIIIAGLVVLGLGILGTFLAQLASAVMFFMTGGLVGVVLGKLISGMPAEDIMNTSGTFSFISLIKPQASDLLWFLGGGIVFLISIDTIIMVSLGLLGAGLIWLAIRSMNLMQPDWIIPLVLAFIGIGFQESMRRRAAHHQHHHHDLLKHAHHDNRHK